MERTAQQFSPEVIAYVTNLMFGDEGKLKTFFLDVNSVIDVLIADKSLPENMDRITEKTIVEQREFYAFFHPVVEDAVKNGAQIIA